MLSKFSCLHHIIYVFGPSSSLECTFLGSKDDALAGPGVAFPYRGGRCEWQRAESGASYEGLIGGTAEEGGA